MIILAIETSCDDTCVAVVEIQGLETKILSNVVSSQVKLHAKYGGVWPFLAKREHQKNLPIVFGKALKEAKKQRSDLCQINRGPTSASSEGIDLIVVTVGPGLEPCLWTGVNFAKEVAKKLNLPIVPVNHIEAHILANFFGEKSEIRNPKSETNSKFRIQNSKLFPAVCLVVSGGHTQLILMKDIGKYKILGETRDDAAGECFDKVARILGIGYPGGPAIAHFAKKQIDRGQTSVRLPRPMIYQKNYDFSFSGLKTAVLYNYKSQPEKIKKSKKYIQAICQEVQQAVIDVLIHKTLKAAKEHKVKTIILGGGVTANDELRKQFKKACLNWKFKQSVPPKNLCTDNAAMVAVAGYFHQKEKRKPEDVEANANLRLK